MDPLPSLEQAVDAARDPTERVLALNALSAELTRTGNARRALALAQEASELAAQQGNGRLDAQTRHALGRCRFYLGEFIPALEVLLDAARLYQECGDLAGAAAAFSGVGLCQHRLGAHDDAVASLMRALESARSMKLGALEINIHNSLGSALIGAMRLDEADRHLGVGSALAVAAGDTGLHNKLLANRALLAKCRGDALQPTDPAAAARAYEDGLALARQALALARQRGNAYDEAHCLGETGTLLRLLRQHGEADQALGKTLALGRASNDPHLQAEALMELGRLRSAEGRSSEAQQLLTESIALARGISARAVLAEACEALSQLLEQQGDFAGALARYKDFLAVRSAELADSRKHAAAAAQLWLDFQDAQRRAERLAADHAELASKAQALSEAVQQDPLTGLLNRRGMETRIGALTAQCELQGMALSVALIDVDHFKQINDSHSHAVGDAVLRRVARIVRDHCRQDDLPVRWGGDEFLLVLAGADLAAAARVLKRLKQAFDACPPEAAGLNATLSIGMASCGRGGGIDAAIASADRALYEAKGAGRNRIATAR